MKTPLEELQAIVRINSVNGNEEPVIRYLEHLLSEAGIDSTVIAHGPKRANLVAEIGDGDGPVLAFDGHADVVAVGDEEKWVHPPFAAEIADGKLYGRGSSDMKSGLIAAVLALIKVKQSGQPIHGKIRLLVTVGEELGLLGASQLADLGYADDIESLVVCEPSGASRQTVLKMPGIPAGFVQPDGPAEQRFIFIAHKGSLTYEVRAKGRAAHSSMPELGINAVKALIDYYEKQEHYFATRKVTDEILGEMTPVVTMIHGGEQANTVPEKAVLTTKIRTVPALTNEAILADLQALIDECNQAGDAQLELVVSESAHPVKSSPQAKIAQLAKRITEKQFNDKLPPIGISGGTDAAKFIEKNPKMAVIVFGPGNDTSHQTDEYVRVDAYENCLACYEKIMTEYFK